MSETKHDHGWGEYFIIFNALIFLTLTTVAFGYVDVGAAMSGAFDVIHQHVSFFPDFYVGHGANIIVGMIIAILKGSLVVWFFMHQSTEEGLNRLVLCFCLSLFFIAVCAFSADIVWLHTYDFPNIAAMAVGAQ